MMEETKVLLEVNEDSSQREAAAGRLVRISGQTGQPNTQAPSYSCPWSSPIFPTLIRLLLWGVWGSLLGLGLLTHHPRLLSSAPADRSRAQEG